MNNTIKHILNHRTIRKWKNQEVSKEILETLYEVANRTATSTGMQTASIIRIVDREIKEKIVEVTTQKYLLDAPELWIFIVDNYRNHKILEEENTEVDLTNNVDRFFAAYTDAAIMAQNVGNAIESLDLGYVFLGSVLNDVKKVIEILELPKYTMPVLGIAFGYPDQNPQLKPRIPYENRIFKDKYQKFDNYHELLKDYDKEMQTYYDLRNTDKTLDAFTTQVVKRNTVEMKKRQEIVEVAKEQGFTL